MPPSVLGDCANAGLGIDSLDKRHAQESVGGQGRRELDFVDITAVDSL